MELLPTKEVARRLHKRPSTIARWVEIGKLEPAVRAPGLRGAMFFRGEDVDRLVEEERARYEDDEPAEASA